MVKCSVKGCNREAVVGYGSIALCERHAKDYEEMVKKFLEEAEYKRVEFEGFTNINTIRELESNLRPKLAQLLDGIIHRIILARVGEGKHGPVYCSGREGCELLKIIVLKEGKKYTLHAMSWGCEDYASGMDIDVTEGYPSFSGEFVWRL